MPRIDLNERQLDHLRQAEQLAQSRASQSQALRARAQPMLEQANALMAQAMDDYAKAIGLVCGEHDHDPPQPGDPHALEGITLSWGEDIPPESDVMESSDG